MLPEERRRQILARIRSDRVVVTRELAKKFGVSNLTINRDLQRLARKHPLKIVRGGAVCTSGPEAVGATESSSVCGVCDQTPRPHLMFSVVLQNGQKQTFCCPHCGLFQWPQLQEGATAILATDTLSGSTLNAVSAWFVVGAHVNPCCTPPVFVFAERDHAERFAQAFGGQIADFESAVKVVHTHMTPGYRH